MDQTVQVPAGGPAEEPGRRSAASAAGSEGADGEVGKHIRSERPADRGSGSDTDGGSQAQGAPSADASTEGDGAASGVKREGEDEDSDRAAGETSLEFQSELRAGVIHVYFNDNRRIGGLYAGRDISARDIAGRDQRSKPGTDGKEAPRSVSVVIVARQELARLRQVTVELGLHERAREILERERFVVLQGPSGVGKGTAALSLLGFDGEIHSVDPSITVRELLEFKRSFPGGSQRRYVVESLSPGTAERLTKFAARAITHALADEQAYLVLTVDDWVLVSSEISAYIVPWRERPDLYRTLRSHLAYYLEQGDVTAVEQRYNLQALEGNLSDRPIHVLDDVARAVAKAFADERPFESVMAEVGFGADERVNDWFREKRSANEIAFLVATAVLGGCSYATVSRHASRLEEFIARRSRLDLSKKALRLTRPRSERLQQSMAVIEPGFVHTEFGRSPSETVRLENRWLVQAVLERVWRQYDLVADALLDWLLECGADQDPGVRLRTAGAAGWLSQFDFATIRARLLVPWALGNTRQARAAANALGAAVWSDASASLVLALLNHWASMRENYDLWWTAAAAYGGDVGVRYTSVAMDQLRGIVLRGDQRAPSIVSFSAADLVQSGGRFFPDVAAQVFSHLAQWLADDPLLAFTAAMAYTGMLRRATDPDITRSQEYWHRLVAVENLPSSGKLLRNALGEKAFRAEALTSIERMVRAADIDRDMHEPLEALLVCSATGSQARIDAERLLHYLERWANAKEPSAAAGVIRRRLQEVAIQ